MPQNDLEAWKFLNLKVDGQSFILRMFCRKDALDLMSIFH